MYLALVWLLSCSAFATDLVRDFVAAEAPRVSATKFDFDRRVGQLVGARPFSKHVISGYSGADYADQDLFRARFTKLVTEARSETKARLGEAAVTVIAMGGTVDGLGVGYKIIRDLKLSDVVVVGMVADQAVAYHLDGLKNGYDVIAPEQDALYVVDTYADADGNHSWEIKTTPGGESQTIRFLVDTFGTPAYSVLHLIEGGEIALKESLEYLIEARRAANRDHARKPALELRLYAGHREGKLKKLKGFKAATQMLLALSVVPALKPANLKITAVIETDDVVFADAEAALRAHPELLFDPDAISTPDQRAAMSADELELRHRAFAAATPTTLALADRQIADGGRRIADETRKYLGWINTLNHPIQDSPEGLAGAARAVRLNETLERELENLRQAVARFDSCDGRLGG